MVLLQAQKLLAHNARRAWLARSSPLGGGRFVGRPGGNLTTAARRIVDGDPHQQVERALEDGWASWHPLPSDGGERR